MGLSVIKSEKEIVEEAEHYVANFFEGRIQFQGV